MVISCTFALAYINAPPMGANMIPIAKNNGSTVLGVRIGCHALSLQAKVSAVPRQCFRTPQTCRCCRNAVFAGLLLFCFFLSDSSLSLMLLVSVCSIVCDMWASDCSWRSLVLNSRLSLRNGFRVYSTAVPTWGRMSVSYISQRCCVSPMYAPA